MHDNLASLLVLQIASPVVHPSPPPDVSDVSGQPLTSTDADPTLFVTHFEIKFVECILNLNINSTMLCSSVHGLSCSNIDVQKIFEVPFSFTESTLWTRAPSLGIFHDKKIPGSATEYI